MSLSREADNARGRRRWATDLRYRMQVTRRMMVRRCTKPDGKDAPVYYGKEVSISVEELMKLWERDNGWDQLKQGLQPSIDRIEEDKGYTFENCRFIPLKENISRNGQTRRGKLRGPSVKPKVFCARHPDRPRRVRDMCGSCYRRHVRRKKQVEVNV